jgi:hypothetical protein
MSSILVALSLDAIMENVVKMNVVPHLSRSFVQEMALLYAMLNQIVSTLLVHLNAVRVELDTQETV